MDKIGYIVAFNSRNPHSMIYRSFRSKEELYRILNRLWSMNEDFIVVSLRMYKVKEDG